MRPKRISDPVYGTISLSEVEVRVIESRAFQRLRNVKQLGLAHYVFPGADYSRFSHAIGVCHVTGRILDHLQKLAPRKLPPKEVQRYRLAALLHDIGHYPYSHAMQDAVEQYYAGASAAPLPKRRRRKDAGAEAAFLSHERVGREILACDAELSAILKDCGFEPASISSIITREEPPCFANLVSSDLDADRIDYLLRSAHHTGLPYGSVDLDYLIEEMALDSNSRVCLRAKALQAADHFLLCRYFDYQQVYFHKTVAALELVLKDLLFDLLRAGTLDCSAQWVSQAIADGSWNQFDDSHLLQMMRRREERSSDKIASMKGDAVLHRVPPRMLAEAEFLATRDKPALDAFRTQRQIARERIAVWADRFDIPAELWWVWDKPGIALTRIGSHVPVSTALNSHEQERDSYDQAIRILAKDSQSVPIVEVKQSLMSVLANYAQYVLRVYCLLPAEQENRREEISAAIRDDLPSIDWH